ncbi:MAG: M42 family metallopeptidase [Saprospiraceae bacterium]|nr:M42 family metallopeptidase [Saprospiraceae bacterium]
MKIISKSAEEFLHKYLNNPSPTGHESEGQKIWLQYIKPYLNAWSLDPYGTLYGIVNPGKAFRVVIEGHSDEISWMVNYITDDGFIYVIRNGGIDQSIAPSKRVIIHTPKGKVRGVFGWPAIHTRKGNDTNLTATLENIFIDVGAKDKAEVEGMGIHVGCCITYEDELFKLNEKYYCGRALDNRIGGFCIAEVARLLKKNKVKLPYSLYIVNSVQEEIGLRGAEMIAQTIKPNLAIVTDVTHDTHTPMLKTKEQGSIKCGLGPVLCYAPPVHNIFQNLVIKTAERKKIPFQRNAASRTTGTDTDAFAYSNGGVPSVLISVPLRYMHTTVETASIDDIENVIKLIYEVLLSIDPKQSFKYF